MSGLLNGKKGVIFGALDPNSIAWKVAEKVHEQGGSFVLTNAPIAMRMGALNDLAEKTSSVIIPADATSEEDLDSLFTKSMEELGGGLDFVLHSIGMSVNVRKGKPYTELNYDWLTKGWDVSAASFHKVLQTAWKHDALNEWGSVLALSYVAAQRSFPTIRTWRTTKPIWKASPGVSVTTMGSERMCASTPSAKVRFRPQLAAVSGASMVSSIMPNA